MQRQQVSPGSNAEREALLASQDERRYGSAEREAVSREERERLLGYDAAKDAAHVEDEDRAPCPMDPYERWILFFAVWGGVLLQGIDTTIVAAMATDIGNSFHQLHRAAWINTAYLLTHATCTPVFGKVSDVVGRRAASNVAWALFTIGGLLAGVAPTMETLIAARLLQGCGGGGLAITASCILSDVCSLRDRAVYSAVGGIAWAVGCGLGAPLGGLCTQSIGWRWAFLLQVPFMIGFHTMIRLRLNYRLHGQSMNFRKSLHRVDWLGSALLVVCVGGLVVAISLRTNEHMAWNDNALLTILMLSLLAFSLFLFVELAYAKEPVVAFRMLCDRNRIVCTMTNLLCAGSTIAAPLYFPMVLIIACGRSPAIAGLHLVPAVTIGCLGGVTAGWIVKCSGQYHALTVGMAAVVVPSLLALSRIGKDTPDWLTWIVMIPTNLGTAGLYSAVNVAMLADVRVDQFGTALGLMILFRSLGQVLGMAGASAVQQLSLDRTLPSVVSDRGLVEAIRRSASVIDSLPRTQQEAVRAVFGDSIRAIFNLGTAVACGTLVATMFISEMPLRYVCSETADAGKDDCPGEASAIDERV